jgi:hypothetical protein
MLLQSIGWHFVNIEIPALAGFLGFRKLSTPHPANKDKYQFILVGFAINPHQAFDGCLQSGFLPDLSNHSLSWHLAAFHAAAGQIPRIDVSPVAQQNATLFIEDDGKCTNCKYVGLLKKLISNVGCSSNFAGDWIATTEFHNH